MEQARRHTAASPDMSTGAKWIPMIVVTLMAIGTVAVFSASANIQQNLELHRFWDFAALRQACFFILAVAVIYGVSHIDYRIFSFSKGLWRSPVTWSMAVAVALLVAVLIPGLGTEVNYARRWLRIPIGPATVSFQPSEFAKWVVVFFLAGFCARLPDGARSFWKGFVPACAATGIVTGLILVEDFGSAALTALLACLLLFMGGARWWFFLTPLPVAAPAFYLAVLGSPSRIQRLCAFLDPEKWADTAAYQANQSLIALGSGGPLGKGLGMGVCKYGHLPEDTTDFVFAVIGEELGFVGTAGIILLFMAFVFFGMAEFSRCRDRFTRLLAAGIVLTVGVQAALNIAVVTVVVPTKGLPLPFVSAGGTSMLLSAAAVGVLVSVARNQPECGNGR